ncbi:MAG TPA: GTP 3',8-cyclase MoaA [Chloroflexia bacterium]|nr:GTP 3',8-cyclase MoaA [Chloroflexia bacterium]
MNQDQAGEEMQRQQLVDAYGRHIKNVRISVTDKCNFRCVYCMPAEGLQWLKRNEILSFEEIEKLVRLLVSMGVEQVRLTGGEPTVRKDLPELIRNLSKIEGLKSLSLTTNGFLLKSMAKSLAEAGLTRINVSIDSLVREKFFQLTRRDTLQQVLEGLEELEKYPQISPIKINAVAMRNFTEDEIVPFAMLARRKPYIVRFIEFMPLDADELWDRNSVLSGDEIKAIIEREVMPLVPVLSADPAETATKYRFADGIGEMGFINPVSHPFCSSCDRIRITAEGMLRTCLFAHVETDLKTPLRNGSSEEVLEEIIRRAVWKKEMKHYINDGEAFKRTKRSMSQIGG